MDTIFVHENVNINKKNVRRTVCSAVTPSRCNLMFQCSAIYFLTTQNSSERDDKNSLFCHSGGLLSLLFPSFRGHCLCTLIASHRIKRNSIVIATVVLSASQLSSSSFGFRWCCSVSSNMLANASNIQQKWQKLSFYLYLLVYFSQIRIGFAFLLCF